MESGSIDLTVYRRIDGAQPWTVAPLDRDGILAMPEIGIDVPVADFYEDVQLAPLEPE